MKALDVGRVRRSRALDVEPLADGVFRVSGGREPHTVNRLASEKIGCDCADARYHTGPCKHAVAVHLHRRVDGRVLDALRSALGAS